MPYVRPLPLAVCLVMCLGAATGVPAQTARVPVPAASGPLPVTAGSYPFAAADHLMTPFDLAAAGYVEEEFLVRGTADVYAWNADRVVTVTTTGAPYTTRILLRRPRAARAFSGAVFVEPMYTPRRWDWAMMWGYLRDGLIARGDAWIGVTMPGTNLAGLKRFNGQRYAALSFTNPAAALPCPGTESTSDSEEGLRWDALSQVAALIKSGAASAPLSGFRVGAVYLTVQGGDLTTYMNAIQPRARMYDGFLARAPFAASRINRCDTAPAADDPRQRIRNVGSPVIAVAGEGDLANTYASRRADSDARDDRYRLYEVPGAGHIDRFAYLGFPTLKDQELAGNALGTVEWPFAAPCTPPVTLMDQSLLRVAYDVALDALDGWVRRGVTPKRIPRIETTAEGSAGFTVMRDAAGNARGGLRTPYVDVPTARYVTTSPGPGNCPEIGHAEPFDAARLRQMYGSFDAYTVKVRRSIAGLTARGWLTRGDGAMLTRELIDNGRNNWQTP